MFDCAFDDFLMLNRWGNPAQQDKRRKTPTWCDALFSVCGISFYPDS
jgi:hypothetical protein